MTKLSKRLTAIAKQVPRGDVVADIGSDHALLPVYLVQTGVAPRAIAGELNDGPFEAAGLQVRSAGLSDRIDVRKGNGLTVLEPEEADTVTIAGMGGALIVDILEQGLVLGRLAGVRSLVLQPNVAEDAVRRWLMEHDYILLDEQILTEDGVTYTILYAEHAKLRNNVADAANGQLRNNVTDAANGQPRNNVADAANGQLYDTSASLYAPRRLSCGLEVDGAMLLRFGPYLIERMEPEFVMKWQDELAKLKRIRHQITDKAGSDDALERIRELDRDIIQIEEVLRCTHQAEK